MTLLEGWHNYEEWQTEFGKDPLVQLFAVLPHLLTVALLRTKPRCYPAVECLQPFREVHLLLSHQCFKHVTVTRSPAETISYLRRTKTLQFKGSNNMKKKSKREVKKL